jgi:hypothetical protein
MHIVQLWVVNSKTTSWANQFHRTHMPVSQEHHFELGSWACSLFCSPIQIFSNFFSIPFCQTHGFDIQIYIVTSNCKVLKTKPVPLCSKHSLICWTTHVHGVHNLSMGHGWDSCISGVHDLSMGYGCHWCISKGCALITSDNFAAR